MDDLFASLASGIRFRKPTKAKSEQVAEAESNEEDHNGQLEQSAPIGFFQNAAKGTRAQDTQNKPSSFKRRSRKRSSAEDSVDPVSTMRDDEVNHFRKKLQIHVRGNVVPPPCATFPAMKIHPAIRQLLLANIEGSDWKEPTAVQMQAIPALLSGRDTIAAAPTGSGKTAAYVIPALSLISGLTASTDKSAADGVRVLLLAPTRELAGNLCASQIHREVLRLSAGRKLRVCLLKKSTVAGAISLQDEAAASKIKFNILIATPMRLCALLRNKAVDLSRVQLLVMDEADKLLETGANGKEMCTSFLAQMDEILAESPRTCVRALFSATIGPQIEEFCLAILRDYVRICVGVANSGAQTIDQKLMYVGGEQGKLLAMRQIVLEGFVPPMLVFLQSKERAKELFHELVYDGINVEVIHAERTQEQRDQIITRFRKGEIWVLLCTDLMARGIDFKSVNIVVNYDFPQSAVSYIHRIGRTGRAGRKGRAITLFTDTDVPTLRSIANVVKLSGCDVPEWMLSLRKPTTHENRKLRVSALRRKRISTTYRFDLRGRKRPRTRPSTENSQADAT